MQAVRGGVSSNVHFWRHLGPKKSTSQSRPNGYANGWNESPGIYSDEMTQGWKLTTNAVHDRGGVIFLQLWHTGRASHSSFHGGKPAVAPSAIKSNEPDIHTPTGKQPHEVPRALATSEIPRVVAETGEPPSERSKPVSTAWNSTQPTAT